MKLDYIFMWFASKASFKKRGIRHHEMDECLNCQFQLKDEHLFCPECGQKVHRSTLSVWSLIAEFFAGLFNLDNGVYRSLKCLPIPGFLSKQFMEGKRKSYLNPIRFFLIAMIVHMTVISNLLPLEELGRSNLENVESIGQQRLYTQFKSETDSLSQDFPGCDVDSIGQVIFSRIDQSQDSITFNGTSDQGFHIGFGLSTKTYRFAVSDMYDMPMDEFIATYELNSYWEKVLGTQVARAMRDPSGAIRFAIGNLIWSILFAVIITALGMKILYIRRNRYYVEHLIVLFNIHTFAFLLASAGFWLGFKLIGPENTIDDWAFVAIILFFFLSLKFYYKQGWIKTFIKFFLISWMYLILLIMMVVLVTVVSFLFF